MTRRPFALLIVSLAALTLSACADATAPTAATSTTRGIQAVGQPNLDVNTCVGGYMTSTGKAC